MSRNSARGFTLIEMLVALSIFASLMTILMLGYSQGLSLWQRGQNRSLHGQSLEYKYGLISNLFVRAQVVSYNKVDGMFVPYFHGDTQTVRLISRAPILDFPGRIRPVELALKPIDGGLYNLYYREAARHSDPARGISWENAIEHVLVDNIQLASFTYEASSFPLPEGLVPSDLTTQDRLRYRETTAWLASFNSEWMWRAPQRIRLDFTDIEGQPHRWTFVLPTRSDAWSLDIYSDD